MSAFWILVLLLVGLVGWAVSMYNRLVSRQNTVEDAWAGIEAQLKSSIT